MDPTPGPDAGPAKLNPGALAIADAARLLTKAGGQPVTEAIRTNVREASLGRAGAAAKAARLVDALFDRFLTKSPPGGWIDRLDARGEPATDFMPASTLYHVLGAVEELLTAVGH